MVIHNNRYRINYTKYRDYFKKKWRLFAMIAGICLILSMFIVSWLMQWLVNLNGSGVGYHLLNPFHIIYYSIGRGALFTVILWIVTTYAVGYYKFYIDMVDFELDPRGEFYISPNGTYGTNRIMSDEEQNSFLTKTTVDQTDKNIMYKDDQGFVYVLTNPNSLGPHKFVCGASGSWKTSSVFIPDMMQTIRRGESMICTDPKGELRSKTYKMAKKHNYIVREFNLIQPILSDGCDFMKLVETYGDARTFTEIIMSNTSNETSHDEDFWAKGERAAICFGILYVKEADEYKGCRTFKNVFEFLKNDLETLNAKAEALEEGSDAKNQWKIFQTTPDNSKGGIMTGVATRLQILNDQAIANITSRDEIDITLPGKRPCIYYVLMSDQESTNNVIASIFFSFMFIKLAKMADQRFDQQLAVTVNFLLDEMPNIGKIPDFPKKLSTIRSRNMRCTICTQDVGQIKDMYPGNLWANVVSNCDTQYMLGCNDSEVTAPFWSNAYGTMTIVVNTERETTSRFKPITINNMRMENRGEGKREVYTIGEICSLDNKYALIRFRGHNVKNGLKFSYFEHPMYKEIEEENYFKHKPLWWNTVAAEAANAQNLKEYEWFAQGIKNIEEQNIQMQQEEEFVKKQEADKKAAEAHKIDRAVNDHEDTKNADIQTRIKTVEILIKRWYTNVKAYLEGNVSGNSEEQIVDNSNSNFNRAIKNTLDQIGDYTDHHKDIDLEGVDDDTPIGAVDERQPVTNPNSYEEELQGIASSDDEPKTATAPAKDASDSEENQDDRLQKRIHSRFKEAAPEKPKKPEHKKSLAGSLETSSVLSRLQETSVKQNDKPHTKSNTNSHSIPNENADADAVDNNNSQVDFEPDEIPEIPEPDLEEPEVPDIGSIPWADSWGSFDDYDGEGTETEPDEPEAQDIQIPEPKTEPQPVTEEDHMVVPGNSPERSSSQTPDVSAILGALANKKKQEDQKKEKIKKRMTTKTGGI